MVTGSVIMPPWTSETFAAVDTPKLVAGGGAGVVPGAGGGVVAGGGAVVGGGVGVVVGGGALPDGELGEELPPPPQAVSAMQIANAPAIPLNGWINGYSTATLPL